MIERRHVFHIGGYDPIAPERQMQRLRRSLLDFEKLWNVSAQISGAITNQSSVSASCDLEAWGPNWKTKTSFEMLRWDDLIERDSKIGLLVRLVRSGHTLLNFATTGTLFRYFGASWKYAAFFLFPYFFLLLFGLCGIGLAYFLTSLATVANGHRIIYCVFISTATFVALLLWLGPRRRINHVLDDAIFSRQFLYDQRPDVEKRIDEFSRRIRDLAKDADVSEIVIVGHSLGAALAIIAVARALKNDSLLAKHGPKICVLTVGATIPKFSLHPKGNRMREASLFIAGESAISWTEYQARDDVISFYRFDPVTLRRISREHSEGRPNIRRVQIHSMLDPVRYKRYRFNFMRMHYQFLMGNDRHSAYDYCMIICGPLDFDLATSRTGPMGRFNADGSVTAGGMEDAPL